MAENFIFISPNFPANYWRFCKELKDNGMNVLGIGDQPYAELSYELRASLHEYYKVDSLENYDEVYRAVAFFAFKYGKIAWLESNNEYWLETDAKLRTDFHIRSGFQAKDIPRIKYKSRMKEYYKRAGLPVARYHLVQDLKGCELFIQKVGYPVVAKPDNGVGASHNFKIRNKQELESFYAQRHKGVLYIMEEFVNGIVNSYDAIVDSNGEIIFETGNVSLGSIMDIVNEKQNSKFYILKKLPEDTKKAGRATVKAFGVRSRFVHFEFFRLLEEQKGLGKKGDIIGLEVNMRPSGGVSPDMINFAHNTDVYKIWADMIAFNHSKKRVGEHTYCAFIGLRDGKPFAMSQEEIMQKYKKQIKLVERVPDALSGAMGNQVYLATFSEEEDMMAFYADLEREK